MLGFSTLVLPAKSFSNEAATNFCNTTVDTGGDPHADSTPYCPSSFFVLADPGLKFILKSLPQANSTNLSRNFTLPDFDG
jgi:hypothetical protein